MSCDVRASGGYPPRGSLPARLLVPGLPASRSLPPGLPPFCPYPPGNVNHFEVASIRQLQRAAVHHEVTVFPPL
jgi:hypothetical protein